MEMNIKEIFERISSGEVSAHSELGSRDESKQTRTFAARIRKMKTVTNIKAHALVFKDVVIPFNPFTGKEDETYNSKKPFRPILLVSQTLQGLKNACAENKELAEKWEKILGAKIKWKEPVSMEDYFAFKAGGFIKPRVMSYQTVSLSFGGIGGFPEFRTRYTVDPTDLDENGSYKQGEEPKHHLAAIFFNGLLRPKANAVEKALQVKGASKENISAEKRAIYSQSPVGFVAPTNLIPFIFLPIGEAPKEFEPDHYSEFESLIRYYGYHNEKWSGCLKEAFDDNTYDDNMDFFDFTIRTPSSSETKPNGQVYTDDDSMELYKAMSITNTDSRFSLWRGETTVDGKKVKNSELYASTIAAAEAYFLHSQEQSFAKEGGETFERLMALSNGFRPISSVDDKFLAACNRVFRDRFADSEFFTEEFKRANSKFIIMMDPKNALALADADEEDLSAAAQQQAESLAALIGDVKSTYNEGQGGEDAVDTLNLSE